MSETLLNFCGKCHVRIERGERDFVDNPEDGNHYHQTCPIVVWITAMGGAQPIRMSPVPCLSLEGAEKACDERLEGVTLRPAAGWNQYATKAGMDFVSCYTRNLLDLHTGDVVGWQTIEAFVVQP